MDKKESTKSLMVSTSVPPNLHKVELVHVWKLGVYKAKTQKE